MTSTDDDTRRGPGCGTGGGLHAVVLAGGAADRLGGADKPALDVGGRSLLDRVLAACADAETTVVVGPRRSTARPVRWTREEPPGGGPLPALAAGLAALPDRDGGSGDDVVLVLAADLPFLTPAALHALTSALAAGSDAGAPGTRWDAALLTDAGGRDQPLAAAYRIEPLRRELALLRTEHGHLNGLPLRLLVRELALRRVSDPTGEASFDCDTWEDLAAARARTAAGGVDGSSVKGSRGKEGDGFDDVAKGGGVSLTDGGGRIGDHGSVDEWIAAVKTELGIDLDVDTKVLLDLARDAAHGVARPAAPLTTFLVGYAAGQARDGGPEAVREAAARAAALAARWTGESGGDPAAAAG